MDKICSGIAHACGDMDFSLGPGAGKKAEELGGTFLKIFCTFMSILLAPFCYCFRRPMGSFVLVAVVMNGWIIYNVGKGFASPKAEDCGAVLMGMLSLNGALAIYNIGYMCYGSRFVCQSMKEDDGLARQISERTLDQLTERYTKYITKSFWTVGLFFGALTGSVANGLFQAQDRHCFRDVIEFNNACTTLQFYYIVTLLHGFLWYANINCCHIGIETENRDGVLYLTDPHDFVAPSDVKEVRSQMKQPLMA